MPFVRRLAIVVPMLAILAFGCVWLPLRELQREARVKLILLQLQESLQHYHVKEERYVPIRHLTGSELTAILAEAGFLEAIPANPYTGRRFSSEDGSDKIFYETDELSETYSLKALKFDSDEVWLEIDSLRHQSLE